MSGPVTVIADPEALAAARREYEEIRRPVGLEEVVARFEKSKFWGEGIPLATFRAAQIRCLGSPSAEVRLAAAHILFSRWSDMRARDVLFELLASPSADMRLRALDALGNLAYEELLWFPPGREVHERFLSLLDDPDTRVRQAAFKPCSYLSGPGISERLLRELRALRASDAPPEELKWLASYIVPRADGPACLEATDLLGTEANEYPSRLGSLETLAAFADPPVRDEARSRFEALFLELLRAGKPLPPDRMGFAGPRMAPALREMLRSENPPLPRSVVLEALGRADPEAPDLLLEIVRKGEPSGDVDAALRGLMHASGADPEAVVRAIEQLHSRPLFQGGLMSGESVQVLLARGGPAGRRFLLERLDRIEPARQDQWQEIMVGAFHNWSAWDVLRELHASGILPRPPEPDPASIRQLRHLYRLHPDAPGTERTLFERAIGNLRMTARISPLDEMRGSLVRYDEFAERIVVDTRSDLPIEAVWQTVERSPGSGKDVEEDARRGVRPACRLRFIAGKRLYEVVIPEDEDNATAVDLVTSALNVAAAREGRRERFIAFGGGEYFEYIYADPAAVHRARMKYFVSAQAMSEEDEREYQAHRARTVLELKAKLGAGGG